MFESIIIWLIIHTILIFVMKYLLKKYRMQQNKWWYSVIIVMSAIIIPISMWRKGF